MRRLMLALGMLAALISPATAQDKKESLPSPKDVTLPKPGPEHEILNGTIGTWDATVELVMQPGGKPEISKGVEVATLIGGGLWLVQDFKGEFMGAPYYGHTVLGYDFQKKKYVGTWVDSMSPGLTALEGTYDPKTRTLTSKVEGPCPEGRMMKMRSTQEWKDADTRVFTMFSPPDFGDEFAMMKITYKRRAAGTH
jgi:hypothetical protein